MAFSGRLHQALPPWASLEARCPSHNIKLIRMSLVVFYLLWVLHFLVLLCSQKDGWLGQKPIGHSLQMSSTFSVSLLWELSLPKPLRLQR